MAYGPFRGNKIDGQRLVFPVGKTRFWPSTFSFVTLRRVFSELGFTKETLKIYGGRDWGSWHDPLPQEIILINRTGREISIPVPVDERVCERLNATQKDSRCGW